MAIDFVIEQGIRHLYPPFKVLEDEFKKDIDLKKQFQICSTAICSSSKYQNNNKLKQMKLKAIRNQFAEAFVVVFFKKIQIVVNIKNSLIRKYFKNKNALYKSNKCPLNCRALGGICLCKNSIGGWWYPIH